MPYLEAHSCLDLLSENLSQDLIEVGHDFDGQLRFDTATTDEIVERVRQSDTDANSSVMSATAA